ncbi:TlpA family protein disulfide reductase [Winogradskyella luteola]|uniref:Thioredoxin family protein n=1 Tax=Winogradskyella luteola TaxID=2828330 RepID=A0A9X1FB65_9FLAO|nr:thioredoxin family protein [Winogradskyella luteola]MBV7270612.1 thioredoxin family protein [Winogradskyella luteola]
MKTNITSIIIALIISSQLGAQNLNVEITENTKSPYLLGKIDKSGLEGENYKSWFTKNYTDYKPNTALVSKISSELKSYDIMLFMGTWCGDSKKEVPKLYKVLEACDFPMEQLTVVAVSRQPDMYKQSPQHEEAGLNIHRVPTIIFYKEGKEVNRIVEHPVNSFEEDILNIITKNDYKSNYQIVAAVYKILNKKGAKGLKRKQKKLLQKYKEKVSGMYELNTYGRILYGTNRLEEAIAVFEFNTKLFPDQPRVFMSLANTLGASGYKEKAIEVLEKAIELHPKNEDLKQNLEVIKSN